MYHKKKITHSIFLFDPVMPRGNKRSYTLKQTWNFQVQKNAGLFKYV